MCVIFIFNGYNDAGSDYSLIFAANRDEYLDRPSECMLPWHEDKNVYGGRDLESGSEGGAWLALNKSYQKIGILLNLPGKKKENALSRGKVVADYVKCNASTEEYIESLKKYDQNCNEFIFVSITYRNMTSDVKTYSNASGKTDTWTDTCLGFGNSLPDCPLTKVKSGKNMMRDICTKLNKVGEKEQLIEELVKFLKNEEKHLPDPQLQSGQLKAFEQQFSSIFVSIPAVRYGTRTHTIFILTKTGHIDLIEITMDSPIDIENPNWKRTQYEFDVPTKNQM